MRRQLLYTEAMFCICKISQDWMQRDLLAKHSKSLDDIAMEKHSRIWWCFFLSHPQYCQYIFPFPDVSKNFFPLRAVQLVHTAECLHNAEEYKPQIVCRTVVIDTEYEIKLLTHKNTPYLAREGEPWCTCCENVWRRLTALWWYRTVFCRRYSSTSYFQFHIYYMYTCAYIYMHAYACACTYTLTYICISGCNLTGKGKHFLSIVSYRTFNW